MAKRRTKEQMAADLAAGAKIDRHHDQVRKLCAEIKTAHHARNRGKVVELVDRMRGHAITLLEHQTAAALAAAKASAPAPAAEAGPSPEGSPDAFKDSLQLPGVAS